MSCCGSLCRIGLTSSRVALRWKCLEGWLSGFGPCLLEFLLHLEEILKLIPDRHFGIVVFVGDRRKKSQKADMMALGHLPQWPGTQASQTSSTTFEKTHSRFPLFSWAIF